MVMFIVTMREELSNEKIKNILSKIFEIDDNAQIVHIYEENINKIISFDIKIFDNHHGFYVELEVFAPEEICLKTKIYNNLSLSLKLIDFISRDIIINNESDNSYKWILIKNSHEIFIADEENPDTYPSIIINKRSMKKLNIEYALSLLPNKEYIEMQENKRPVYYVKDFNLWLKE